MKKEPQPITTAEAMQMIAEAFNEPVEDLKPDRLRESLAGWDSMGALMLIAQIDERFGVELSADTSREMTSIHDILKFLGDRGLLRD